MGNLAYPNLDIVGRLEQIPTDGPSIFLAGPTPRSPLVPSWRPEAIALIEEMWAGPRRLTVITPEPIDDDVYREDYDDQIDWEFAARTAATAIAYWVPRDLVAMPGFTTNVEFGYDVAKRPDRVVLGCPPSCPNPERNRYLIHLAYDSNVPVSEFLANTIRMALDIAWRGISR